MRNKPDDGGEPSEADRLKPGFDAKAWKRAYQRLYMKKLRERERRLMAESKAAYAALPPQQQRIVQEALMATLMAMIAGEGDDKA
jgi:hypothetical protein